MGTLVFNKYQGCPRPHTNWWSLCVKTLDNGFLFVVIHILHVQLRKRVPRTWLYFSWKYSSGELMLVSRLQKGINSLNIEIKIVSSD